MTDQHARINKKLHRKAKISAVKEGISLKEWLDRAIEEALKKSKK